MFKNKYDFYSRKARELQNLINASAWGRKKIVYQKPVWTGNYKIKWVLNEKHATHPLAEIAKSLLDLIPCQYIGRFKSGEYGDYLIKTSPRFYITQEQYDKLSSQQKKFFSNMEGLVSLTDRKGNKIYKIRPYDFSFFFSPKVVKDKIKYEWVRIEEPDIRKYYEKLYKTGFGNRYLFIDKPRVSERIYNKKGKGRKEERELQRIINEGLQEVFS